MIQTYISEIREYIAHKDYDLSFRRLLDLTYLSSNKSLMAATMQCSGQYAALKSNGELSEWPTGMDEQVQKILDELASIPLPKVQQMPLVETSNIQKSYGSNKFAIGSAPLTIKSGEIVGVVGENGNGKTTLLRTLAGQLLVNDGDISYPMLQSSKHYDIKNYVVFIAQRIPRWYGKLKDNLHFSASLAGVFGAENDLLVGFMIERLGLQKYADYTWETISSGYRTRFEIARVLLQKPQLLILDEPLANLDINAQQTLLTDLRYIVTTWRDPLGIILSSQQLHEVEKVADNIIYIKAGQCTLNPVKQSTVTGFVIEIESSASRNDIAQALPSDSNIHFNGGLYIIHSEKLSAKELLQSLVNQQISVTYFRDITHSSKRLF